MKFKVIEVAKEIGNQKNCILLLKDNWDDWSKYRTQFHAYYYDEDGKEFPIGEVKIGKIGLKPGRTASENTRAPDLEEEFEKLGEAYFSLGQGSTFYESLNALGNEIRVSVLEALRDVAYELSIFEMVFNEDVMKESLLRSVRTENVRTKLHNLAHGVSGLTEFEFEYLFPESKKAIVRQPPIDFHVIPESQPPTNIHVLIGRNGVGKTRLLRNIGNALLGIEGEDGSPGIIKSRSNFNGDWYFSGLVSVSFSAFDDYEFPISPSHGIKASMVGLRDWSKSKNKLSVKSPSKLTNDFINAFDSCRSGIKIPRLKRAVKYLENDPLFAQARIMDELCSDDEGWAERARTLFSQLSSGHKIVLLTITKLVELVDERTLVLMDEPEGHLHPPLLSAFLSSIADLLIKRNGVAIIATHSPVVLQEVPSSCVWVLDRSGDSIKAERPERETFGENVGALTRDIFSLEVTTTGFHKILSEMIFHDYLSYEEVVERLAGQLGAEGRSIAKALDSVRSGVKP